MSFKNNEDYSVAVFIVNSKVLTVDLRNNWFVQWGDMTVNIFKFAVTETNEAKYKLRTIIGTSDENRIWRTTLSTQLVHANINGRGFYDEMFDED